MTPSVPTGWTLSGNALTRTIQRTNFVEALALVQIIGKLAEAANHHPDIDIRYRTVHLSLSTHDSGNQVTKRDYALAAKINDVNEDSIRIVCEDLRLRFSA